MSNYPGAIDGAASLYSPVDAFSGAPLETTTTGAVLPGDSTISTTRATSAARAARGLWYAADTDCTHTSSGIGLLLRQN